MNASRLMERHDAVLVENLTAFSRCREIQQPFGDRLRFSRCGCLNHAFSFNCSQAAKRDKRLP
jgi:hypothetical protein